MVFLFLNPIQHNNTIQFKRKRRLRKQDDQSESVRTIEISGSRYGFLRSRLTLIFFYCSSSLNLNISHTNSLVRISLSHR